MGGLPNKNGTPKKDGLLGGIQKKVKTALGQNKDVEQDPGAAIAAKNRASANLIAESLRGAKMKAVGMASDRRSYYSASIDGYIASLNGKTEAEIDLRSIDEKIVQLADLYASALYDGDQSSADLGGRGLEFGINQCRSDFQPNERGESAAGHVQRRTDFLTGLVEGMQISRDVFNQENSLAPTKLHARELRDRIITAYDEIDSVQENQPATWDALKHVDLNNIDPLKNTLTDEQFNILLLLQTTVMTERLYRKSRAELISQLERVQSEKMILADCESILNKNIHALSLDEIMELQRSTRKYAQDIQENIDIASAINKELEETSVMYQNALMSSTHKDLIADTIISYEDMRAFYNRQPKLDAMDAAGIQEKRKQEQKITAG